MTQPLLDVTWDDMKARSNLAKHGVTFAQAATVARSASAHRLRLSTQQD
jgi:uncharacterized DUF497 family protein